MYEIQLKERIMGYSTKAVRGGEMAEVQVFGATSTEDGDLHLKYLEGFPQTVLSMLPCEIQPFEIKTLVVLIAHDLKAKVYVNELKITGLAITKAKRVEKGQHVTRDDIIGVDRIKLGNISFPDDNAYFCVLSIGWDKAYLFDFTPLNDQVQIKLEYDVEKFIGSYVSYLMFKTVHKISDSEWQAIFNQNWFPFSALKFATIELMINHIRAGWYVDELIDKIDEDASSYLNEWIQEWETNGSLTPYVDFLKKAFERHQSDDYVSSVSILYPQIEGLLRKDFIKDNPSKEGRKQDILIAHLTSKAEINTAALTTYLPSRFKDFLQQCYFRDFVANSTENEISRHSVAHGASSIEKYSRKESLLGLLAFSQISQYIVYSSKRNNLLAYSEKESNKK